MTKRGAKKPASKDQPDLFASVELFPVRRPIDAPRAVDLSLRIKSGISRALKESPESAPIIAARISEMTGRELSTDMLYAYSAASKPEHDMPITRFVAFVRATESYWLYDMLVEDDGLMVLEGREARLAQLGHIRQEKQRLAIAEKEIERELQEEPVRVNARRSGAR